MALLSPAEIRRIEKKFGDGISSAEVVEIFRTKGSRFSEATLRKYVQLGLLPKSRRVGTRGRNRGSSGRYPVAIVRLIADIKQALDAGATLEEIRVSQVGLSGEVEALQRIAQQVMKRFEEAIRVYPDPGRKVVLERTLEKNRKSLVRDVRDFGRLAMKMGSAGVAS